MNDPKLIPGINSLEAFVVKKVIYDPCGFVMKHILPEEESTEYSAYRYELNGLNICFRLAKITPTKTGQFVTLWKRINKGPIMPFDASDEIDFVVISIRKDNNYGQFVFPKAVLIKQGIFTDAKEGKRAIRVYPSWDITESTQAKKTQKWQLEYFLEVPIDKPLDIERVKMLYQFKTNVV
ncbi:MepB protein [compost metagenome]